VLRFFSHFNPDAKRPKFVTHAFAKFFGKTISLLPPQKELLDLLTDPGSIASTSSAKGMLLYGPPGTGKTTLARILMEIPGTRPLGKDTNGVYSASWFQESKVGQTEKKIRLLLGKALDASSPLHDIHR